LILGYRLILAKNFIQLSFTPPLLSSPQSFMLLSSLENDEHDRVNGIEKAKEICDTLQRAHEGTKPVKKAKIQLVEGQLDRFIMLDDEASQEILNQLTRLVNKIRAYGSRRWSDRRLIQGML
jgi:hypothetical protein